MMILQCKQIGSEWKVKRMVFTDPPEKPDAAQRTPEAGKDSVESTAALRHKVQAREEGRLDAAWEKLPAEVRTALGKEELEKAKAELAALSEGLEIEWENEKVAESVKASHAYVGLMSGMAKGDLASFATQVYESKVKVGRKLAFIFVHSESLERFKISRYGKLTGLDAAAQKKDEDLFRATYIEKVTKGLPDSAFTTANGIQEVTTLFTSDFLEGKHKDGAEINVTPQKNDTKGAEIQKGIEAGFGTSIRTQLRDVLKTQVSENLGDDVEKRDVVKLFRTVSFSDSATEIGVVGDKVVIPSELKAIMNTKKKTPDLDIEGKKMAYVNNMLVMADDPQKILDKSTTDSFILSPSEGWKTGTEIAADLEIAAAQLPGVIDAALKAKADAAEKKNQADRARENALLLAEQGKEGAALRFLNNPIAFAPAALVGKNVGTVIDALVAKAGPNDQPDSVRKVLVAEKAQIQERLDFYNGKGVQLKLIKLMKFSVTGGKMDLVAYADAQGTKRFADEQLQAPQQSAKAQGFLDRVENKLGKSLRAMGMGDLADSIGKYITTLFGAIGNFKFVQNLISKNASVQKMMNKAGNMLGQTQNFNILDFYDDKDGKAVAEEPPPSLQYDKEALQYKFMASSDTNKRLPSGRVCEYSGAEMVASDVEAGKKFQVTLLTGAKMAFPAGTDLSNVKVNGQPATSAIDSSVTTQTVVLDKIPTGLKFDTTHTQTNARVKFEMV